MTTIRTLAHDDTTVREVTFDNGTVIVVANDPDSIPTAYCLDCEAEILPVVQVTVLNSEEWDYAPEAWDRAHRFTVSLCPECFGTDICRADDVDQIQYDRMLDAIAEVREQARKDGER
jgi:hypothetical protein